ncbi:MAG: Phosphopentomutase [Firmicutes bacterium]|nr:Phosphopentomutase [Bacillota bacterium]
MIGRVILIVMDSVGIGELPDAWEYGDEGSNTLGHIYSSVKGFRLPNMERMGLGNIDGITEIPGCEEPVGCYGKAAEMSKGKDTTTGHWEMMGVILDNPFPTYPKGFPGDLIMEFEKQIGRRVLGNKVASGTAIIEELGEEHMATGFPIVYTSADSVFQIAAHEDVIPLEELYRICETARGLLVGQHRVARVIARPFSGTPGAFGRTSNRKDYSVEPPKKTLLDYAVDQGIEVSAVGKIVDIFSGRGITRSVHTSDNRDGIDKTVRYLETIEKGIVFTNLVDFDMRFGHRNNVEGYAKALVELDDGLTLIMDRMGDGDILIITADHGCDPTTESTDHSREFVPILVYGKKAKRGNNLGIRKSFSDIGATVADVLGIKNYSQGVSFKEIIL